MDNQEYNSIVVLYGESQTTACATSMCAVSIVTLFCR